MIYEELIAKAVKGRTVNSLAKEWGIPQKTLDNYVKGTRTPDFHTALILVRETGLSAEKVLMVLAEHEANRKLTKRDLSAITDKFSPSFEALLRLANTCWNHLQRVAQ
ncbi:MULTISPECIES: transcriptional regulator [Herbaspirillum]|uniref:Transcriptional regulator n=1 Tax=Herbaspirillum rubrisubalbicans TaxID=80842 RepID=A0AAD0U7H2_9BURK|nr:MULTISPECIES: transcriptional regulator [Herbaspirillum]AYR24525.1 transcriptional regulator [Herbaspirillum rubrisubalbicans]